MFRFSIRELILVTVIVAMAIGWAMDRTNLQGRATRLHRYSNCLENRLSSYKTCIEEVGGRVVEKPDGFFIMLSRDGKGAGVTSEQCQD